jgi:hypothetical protein
MGLRIDNGVDGMAVLSQCTEFAVSHRCSSGSLSFDAAQTFSGASRPAGGPLGARAPSRSFATRVDLAGWAAGKLPWLPGQPEKMT